MRRDTQGRRLCTARRADGEPCNAPAVRGATVCTHHGAAKGTNGRAAADRLVLSELVGPAMLTLQDLIEDVDTPPAVRLGAARDILDRTGYKPILEVKGVPTVAQFDEWIEELEAEQG